MLRSDSLASNRFLEERDLLRDEPPRPEKWRELT
jgi:hypothetical protein